MTRAISYDRVSTRQQAGEGVALGLRVDALRAYALANDFTLVAEATDEAVSGAVPFAERPGGALVLATARQHKGMVLLAPSLDRLFRDSLDGQRCMRETFPALQLRVVLVDQALDLGTPEGRLQASMLLAVAEYEREQIGARTRRTSRALQSAGRAYGHTPFGCIRIGDALFRDPTTWQQRDSIVARCASHSLRDVSADVRRSGIPAPNGGQVWSTSTIREIAKTHDRLALLPLAPGASGANGATHPVLPLEAQASPGAHA